jgi:hypothetical protein
MRTNLFVGRFSQSFLAVVLAGCGLAACTTQEVTPDGGGGSGPGGSGGGTGGTGGGSSQYPPSDGIACPTPTVALITDFTYNPDAGVMDQVTFGDFTTTFSGGQYYYPMTGTYAITSNMTGSNWHLTGMVGDYSGFGLFFAPNECNRINASAFRGISFTISGTVMGSAVIFEVDTLKNAIAPSWLSTHGATPKTTDAGHCVPNAAAVNQYAQTDCVQPTTSVPVTANPTPQTILWGDFTNGKPDPAPNKAEIVGIRWILPNPPGVATPSVAPYMVDLVIDNLSFVQ